MNYLKEFLDIQIPRIHKYNNQYNIDTKDFYQILEHQVLIHAMPRGFGTTTEVREIFNPSTDLYVSNKIPTAKEFTKSTGGYYFSINCTDDNSIRGKTGIENVNRVFIDIGANGVLIDNYAKLVNRTIRLLHRTLSEDCIYIIV